jgi:hypothetical protein
MYNRMREALAKLGRIGRAVVRPPFQRFSDEERWQIRDALKLAGLLDVVPVRAPTRITRFQPSQVFDLGAQSALQISAPAGGNAVHQQRRSVLDS